MQLAICSNWLNLMSIGLRTIKVNIKEMWTGMITNESWAKFSRLNEMQRGYIEFEQREPCDDFNKAPFYIRALKIKDIDFQK